MNELEYKLELKKVLDEYSSVAIKRLDLIFNYLPVNFDSFDFGIFPDQDGEGTFSVRVFFKGKDSYTLNKSIKDFANVIIGGFKTNSKFYKVPTFMDPFVVEFEVNDALCDTVADWIANIWKSNYKEKLDKPVTIFGDDDYGTQLPMEIN